MKLRHTFFALATTTLFATFAGSTLGGCAADTSAADADDEEVEETADELSAAGKKLIGTYVDDSGAFKTIVLTAVKVGQANRFSADVDTGIRCITTPCPSAEHIEGTFTAGPKTITFRSTTASASSKHLLGQYKYLVQGSKFSIFRKGFAQSLAKQAVDPCEGLDQSACLANSACQAKWGPSACTADGLICTADIAFKGCSTKVAPPPPPPPPSGTVCLSSGSCGAGEHCSTEDGVCNPYGMLAVCAGTCVGASK